MRAAFSGGQGAAAGCLRHVEGDAELELRADVLQDPPFARRSGSADACGELGDVAGRLVQRVLDQERVLVGEVVVHRGAAHAGGARDRGEGDGVEVLRLEELGEGAEDLLASALAVLLE